jgi:hypothetical protein
MSSSLLPGTSSLGYGFNVVTATAPSSVLSRVVKLDEAGGTNITKFGTEYLIPQNVDAPDAVQSSLISKEFASESEYSNYMATETGVKTSAWGFSGQFSASYASLLEGASSSFYGLVKADSSLWDTNIKSMQGIMLTDEFSAALKALPAIFSAQTQKQFFDLFDLFGTHIITGSKVGGSLNYLVTLSTSSSLSMADATLSMSLEYKSLFTDTSASASADWQNMNSAWISSRNARLVVVGGDPTSSIGQVIPPSSPTEPSSNNLQAVNSWATTLKKDPAVIGLSLQPISHVAAGSQYEQIDKALNVYLNYRISATNVSTFVASGVTTPLLTENSTTIVIADQVVYPSQPPAAPDLSHFWIVMADDAGQIAFNQSMNSSQPEDLDALIDAATTAAGERNLWACVSVVSPNSVPISSKAMSWLQSLGIDVSSLENDNFYPGGSIALVGVGRNKTATPNGRFDYIDTGMIIGNSVKRFTGERFMMTTKAAVPMYVSLTT